MSWAVDIYATKADAVIIINNQQSVPDAVKKLVESSVALIPDIDPNGGNWEQANHVHIIGSGHGGALNNFSITPILLSTPTPAVAPEASPS
jgi:hypothetical protein